MSNKTVPIHGNYHGYYTKRPFVRDPRLALLPPELFHGSRVLDVGCNEGWVTCEIGQLWGAAKVVGVDIDEQLIRAAWRKRRSVWSSQGPSYPSSSSSVSPSNVVSQVKKRKRGEGYDHHDGDDSDAQPPPRTIPQPDYFPASCEHEFGSLPIPPSEIRGKGAFPHNVSFRTGDWTTEEIPEDKEGYDLVIAFSLTKWIHLNQGDAGILRFFKRVYDVLVDGGKFVLEPQAWETYNKAKRMNATLKENAQSIRLLPDQFEATLVEMGFAPAEHFGTAGTGGFRRPVEVYTKVAK